MPKATTAVMSPAWKSGDAEEQVQAERRPDELREVGRHRDDLRLQPEDPVPRGRERVPAELGQAPAGRDARLGGEVLGPSPP